MCAAGDFEMVEPLMRMYVDELLPLARYRTRHYFGHGGAYSTNTTADTGRGLILIWLVQHAGFPGQGGQAQGAFRKAAIEAFAPRAAVPAASR